ncbi:TetR/AcrR family transcriptional regulator [Ureibacillus terrenus]|uniref:TetR/AcrR family transcriptional regulator n=1 Tax=Ureibacillus terrenus TaxID=118246 RepID=A0A540UZ47_9BACL|nr:TetR/AcrR family transcriptional regulator [Ureibacillus terrenus]MED3662134.1 TetR/AcrR family transcriptional regulator [Ureibacillus terrenus]MED3764453.1 TetR/AcrR family transcriptional regulator [Ureibacillus terrenus]TQE89780.1 TetR/AcrR family transcriptional regulator [Ureibacillus terrenus]
MINYYFGSKENLINEAIHSLITSLKDTFTIFDDPSLTPKEQIRGFLLQYLRIFRKYPFIIHLVMQENSVFYKSQIEYFEFLNAIGMKKFKNAIREASGEEDPKKLTIMVSHLIGAALLPTLIEPLYEYVTGSPFSNIETQIDILLQQYFS